MMSLTVAICSEGEEEDDDAYQQHHHHHHRCQEEGSARRPTGQPVQGFADAARLPVAFSGWAGKPNIQGAV